MNFFKKLLEGDGYLKPFIAGVGLGLVLLGAIVISGQGLGASGAMMRLVVAFEKLLIPFHVDTNVYLAKYGGGDKNPLDNWLIFEVVGVMVGGFLSAVLAGRVKKEIFKGPRITEKQRLITSFIGGSLFGFGARMAGGCTSGVALSGGATLALGSWVTMFCIFGGAYAVAYFIRKLWT